MLIVSVRKNQSIFKMLLSDLIVGNWKLDWFLRTNTHTFKVFLVSHFNHTFFHNEFWIFTIFFLFSIFVFLSNLEFVFRQNMWYVSISIEFILQICPKNLSSVSKTKASWRFFSVKVVMSTTNMGEITIITIVEFDEIF